MATAFASLLSRDIDRSTLLRWTFVGMLFALAIESVAVSTLSLFQQSVPWERWPPAILHLLLAFCVISASWVGWSRSLAPGNHEPLRRIFSLPYLVLLVDLILVIVYIIIAGLVELPSEANPTPSASARPEALGLTVMFCLYMLWDLLADVMMHWEPNRSLGRFLKRAGLHAASSFICTALAALVLWLAYAAGEGDLWVTIAGDVALISLVFVFRALKNLEHISEEFLNPRGALNTRVSYRHWFRYSLLLVLTYVTALFAAALRIDDLSKSFCIVAFLTVGIVLVTCIVIPIVHTKRFIGHHVRRELVLGGGKKVGKPAGEVARCLRELPTYLKSKEQHWYGFSLSWDELCNGIAQSIESGETEFTKVIDGTNSLTWKFDIEIENAAVTVIRIREEGQMHAGRWQDRFGRGHHCRIERTLKALGWKLDIPPHIE